LLVEPPTIIPREPVRKLQIPPPIKLYAPPIRLHCPPTTTFAVPVSPTLEEIKFLLPPPIKL